MGIVDSLTQLFCFHQPVEFASLSLVFFFCSAVLLMMVPLSFIPFQLPQLDGVPPIGKEKSLRAATGKKFYKFSFADQKNDATKSSGFRFKILR